MPVYVIKSQRRLIYALAVNRPLASCTRPISSDRCKLSTGTGGRCCHYLFARFTWKSRGRRCDARHIVLRQSHRGTKSRIVRMYPWKRNNYTRRCNYCGWPRSTVVNNQRDATIIPPPALSRGKRTRHATRCSDITNLSWDPPLRACTHIQIHIQMHCGCSWRPRHASMRLPCMQSFNARRGGEEEWRPSRRFNRFYQCNFTAVSKNDESNQDCLSYLDS